MHTCPFHQPECALVRDGLITRRPRADVELAACAKCRNPVLLRWDSKDAPISALPGVADIERSAPPGSIGDTLLAALPQAMRKLPMLPEVSMRVQEMVSDPETTMADLAAVIENDPVIAVAVMRLANSAMYGGLHPAKDLKAACSRLGMRTVANAAQAVATANLFHAEDDRLRVYMNKLWRHSVATAHCAAEVAQLVSEPRAEAVFFAGLIHDIGKLVMVQIVARERGAGAAKLRESPELFREVLRALHPLAGLHVVQTWELPPEFGATTYFHHAPESCVEESWSKLVHIVALSNLIASVQGYGVEPAAEVFLASLPSARYLGLTDIKIAALRVDLADKLDALLDASSAPHA